MISDFFPEDKPITSADASVLELHATSTVVLPTVTIPNDVTVEFTTDTNEVTSSMGLSNDTTNTVTLSSGLVTAVTLADVVSLHDGDDGDMSVTEKLVESLLTN